MVESFSERKTKVSLHFYLYKRAAMKWFFSNLENAVFSNYLHVQCYDSVRSFVVLKELSNNEFNLQVTDMCHIFYLKIFACWNPSSELYHMLAVKGPTNL